MKYFHKKAREWLDQGDDSQAIPRVCSSLGVMNIKSDQSAQLCVPPARFSLSEEAGRSEEVALTEIGVFKVRTMKQEREKKVEGACKEKIL